VKAIGLYVHLDKEAERTLLYTTLDVHFWLVSVFIFRLMLFSVKSCLRTKLVSYVLIYYQVCT